METNNCKNCGRRAIKEYEPDHYHCLNCGVSYRHSGGVTTPVTRSKKKKKTNKEIRQNIEDGSLFGKTK